MGEEQRQYREPQREYRAEPFWVKYNLATQRTQAFEPSQTPPAIIKKDLGYLVLAHQRRS